MVPPSGGMFCVSVCLYGRVVRVQGSWCKGFLVSRVRAFLSCKGERTGGSFFFGSKVREGPGVFLCMR